MIFKMREIYYFVKAPMVLTVLAETEKDDTGCEYKILLAILPLMKMVMMVTMVIVIMTVTN